jgi:RNA polymerase sigma factor (sigma-70 family)
MLLFTQRNEQELTALLREGDEAAFVEIYRRNWQKLYNAAYKRLRDGAQCEDLLQNIFADLWERREEVFIENLNAYLHTAVRFQVIKYATRTTAASRFTEELDDRLSSPIQTDDPLIERETLDLVKIWVAALPRKRREIFHMYYHEGLSSADIARELGISQKTVQNQIATVINSLHSRLSKVLAVVAILMRALTWF